MADLEQRVAALEQRMEAIESRPRGGRRRPVAGMAGAELVALRASVGMSMRTMATKLRMSVNAVFSMEHGTTTIDVKRAARIRKIIEKAKT